LRAEEVGVPLSVLRASNWGYTSLSNGVAQPHGQSC
jgi:hypothetical protein